MCAERSVACLALVARICWLLLLQKETDSAQLSLSNGQLDMKSCERLGAAFSKVLELLLDHEQEFRHAFVEQMLVEVLLTSCCYHVCTLHTLL